MKFKKNYQQNNPTLSQAHWQVAPTNAKSKTCQRACLFSNPKFADTKKLNLC